MLHCQRASTKDGHGEDHATDERQSERECGCQLEVDHLTFTDLKATEWDYNRWHLQKDSNQSFVTWRAKMKDSNESLVTWWAKMKEQKENLGDETPTYWEDNTEKLY